MNMNINDEFDCESVKKLIKYICKDNHRDKKHCESLQNMYGKCLYYKEQQSTAKSEINEIERCALLCTR